MLKRYFQKLLLSRLLTVAPQYGLIGSTEWGEDFPEFIGKNVVAYLNLGVFGWTSLLG
jgi:hypothetical protein